MNKKDVCNILLNHLSDYYPIIHTNKEKDYNWLKENGFRIEIKNVKGNELFIDLQDEITISFYKWHCHFNTDDYDDVVNNVKSIIQNKECIIIFNCNNKCYGSGWSINKKKYTKKESYEFLKQFMGKNFLKNRVFQQYGVDIEFLFWNNIDNYEIHLEKELFY